MTSRDTYQSVEQTHAFVKLLKSTYEGPQLLNIISNMYGLTIDEADVLRNKLTGYNNILIAKYGDKYLENANSIMVETQAYKNRVIAQLKSKR